MVKCPRGTPSQIKRNLEHFNTSSTPNNDDLKGQEEEGETFVGESEGSELDSVRIDKRCPPTPRDELVYFFIGHFLDILLRSWEGKPCVKPKLSTLVDAEKESMVGEDLGPCRLSIVSSADDYLHNLYQKRSSNLSQEKEKKDSETTDSEEYLNEDDFESPGTPDLKRFVADEDVHFFFLNGVWYKGRVSRRMMDGEGFYFWEDGTTFQGEFEGGCVTGKGRMEFPDMSVYEGGVYKAFRHGEGMFCFADSPVMYSGQWWLGKKHGHGLIVYNHPSDGHNFYNGQFQSGLKEGFGFRQYPSGAKYIGFWSNGKRHGKGIMFWSNNDIYRGEWKEGLMHGYGEYTWNGFINESLSYPASNIYRGYWEEGKRNGRGLLELKNGSLIETVWVNNQKDGLGVVISGSGAVVVAEKLFSQDKPAYYPAEADHELPMKQLVTHKRRRGAKEVKADGTDKTRVIAIPVNSPVHTLNLSYHTQKCYNQLNIKNLKIAEEARMLFEFLTMTPESRPTEGLETQKANTELTEIQYLKMSQQIKKEEKFLRNFIILKLSALRECYDCYATLACEKPPSSKCVLLRLFLWQMLIDGRVPSSKLSLIEIDNLLAREEYILLQDPHYPFERIQFWQFIQILIFLSWHLYGQYVTGELPLVEDEDIKNFLQYFGNCDCKTVLKTALEYFIEKNLTWEPLHEGKGSYPERIHKFEESDFAPMEAMHLIYCNVGEPHSARDFVNAICCKKSEDGSPIIVRYFEKLPMHKIDGKNALTIAGELQHIPRKEYRFNAQELFQLEESQVKVNPKSELTCLNGLKAKGVISCLVEVCPGIMSNGLIVNMDYKLTFLEFYKAIILCTKKQIKMKMMDEMKDEIISEYKAQLEEYHKLIAEYEKQREGVSRRKSRQMSDVPKKGKK